MEKVEGAGGSRADGPLMVPPDLSLRLSRPRSKFGRGKVLCLERVVMAPDRAQRPSPPALRQDATAFQVGFPIVYGHRHLGRGGSRSMGRKEPPRAG